MTPPTAVFTASVIDGQVDHLNEQLPDFLGHPARTATDSLELLAAVRATRQKLYDLEQSLERDAAKRMAEKTLEWAGGYAAKHRTAKSTKWDERTWRRVMEAVIVDENGELPTPDVQQAIREAVEKVVDRENGAAAISYWRKGKLLDLQIDPDDYCKTEWGRWVVDVALGPHAEAEAS